MPKVPIGKPGRLCLVPSTGQDNQPNKPRARLFRTLSGISGTPTPIDRILPNYVTFHVDGPDGPVQFAAYGGATRSALRRALACAATALVMEQDPPTNNANRKRRR